MKQEGSPNWGRQDKATHQPEQLREQPQQVHEQKGGFCVNIGSFNGGKYRTTNPWTQPPTKTQTQPQPQPHIKCHQKKGSAMRMFVLGGESSSESSCTGTGVFLPRGIWYSSEPRKKQGTNNYVRLCLLLWLALICWVSSFIPKFDFLFWVSFVSVP